MTGKIFINYRRGDDPGFTQALYQRLEDEFAAGGLFMDVEGHIKPGDDFAQVLNAQVAASDVLLVVIGPRWADLFVARHDDPDDFVAIEIKAALDQDKRVIPVLVGGAGMPRTDTLPEAIRPLARRNAVGLRPERFKADCQGLVAALRESLAAAEQERTARTEAERKAVEAARREAEEQAAARAKAAEERGRAQAAAGLSSEEIRKAEELASWDFVKDRKDIDDLRDHLARFPGGTTARYALAKLDELVWVGLGSSPIMQKLRAYLEEFPKGTYAAAAQKRIAELEQEAADARAAEQRRVEETAEWGAIAASIFTSEIEAFLARWPNGQHADAARARLQELNWRRVPGDSLSIDSIGVAAGFLVAVIPIALALMMLFDTMHWSWLGVSPWGAGFLTGAALAIVSAVVLAIRRGSALTGTEVAFYWAGSVMVGTPAMNLLFSEMKWSWLGVSPENAGLLTGAGVSAIVGLLLYWRRSKVQII
jgi:hypothetical protein